MKSPGVPRKLTPNSVEAIKPGPVRQEIRDGLLRGLWLFVQPSGRKSWGVRYSLHGQRIKHILGPYPAIGLAKARELARDVLEKVALGIDPRARKVDTFASGVAAYLDVHVSTLRRGTSGYVKRELNAAAEYWRGRLLTSIIRADVIALANTARPRGVNARNTCIKVLSSFFRWAMSEDMIPVNPTLGVRRIKVEDRERVLTDDELATVWKNADAFVRLLILTGMRRNEAAGLLWSEIGPDAIELPVERVKTGRALRVPIVPAIRAVLDSVENRGPYLWRGAKPLHVSGRANDIAKFKERWTLHDLRRTFATGLQILGVSFPVIEAALNHKIRGIAGVYQRHSFENEIRDALEKWGAYVATITAHSQDMSALTSLRSTSNRDKISD
jgi:integrase